MQKATLYGAFLVPLLLQGQEALLAGVLLLMASALLFYNTPLSFLQEVKKPITLTLLILTAAGATSLLWSKQPDFIVLLPLYLALWSMLSCSLEKEEALFLMLLGAGLLAVSGILGVVFETTPWAVRLEGAWRASGTVHYPLALVAVLGATLPWILLKIGQERSFRRAFFILLVPCFLTALFLTGSRAALLVVLALAASLLLWPQVFMLSRRESLLFVTSATILFCALLFIQQPEWPGEPSSGLLGGREAEWMRAVSLIAERPWGWGLGSWQFISGLKPLFSHSFPLQWGLEAGVPALVAATGFIFFWARESARKWRFLLAPLMLGLGLFLFDWAWLLPAVGAFFLLSTSLAAQGENRYSLG